MFKLRVQRNDVTSKLEVKQLYTAKTSVNILTLYDVYLEQQIININRRSI